MCQQEKLLKNKSLCSGCFACESICPVGAVSMKEDENGFLFPKVNEKKCIGCGACERVCQYHNPPVLKEPTKVYFGHNNKETVRKQSSSGGMFSSIAANIFEKKGVVYGASIDEDFNVYHYGVDNEEELHKILKSKYVQSYINDVFIRIKKDLSKDKYVLFCGTPCQIAGLLNYIGKYSEKLYTIDLVCHGVPNQRMFKKFIAGEQNRCNKKITELNFRDKEYGWGKNLSFTFEDGTKKRIYQTESYYMTYFSKGLIFRDSCYACPYATKRRVGDITLGDYWGIEKEHPEYLKNISSLSNGVSLVLINSQKADVLFSEIRDSFLNESSFEKCSRANHQLISPVKIDDEKRKLLLSDLTNMDYQSIRKVFLKQQGVKIFITRIKSCIPSKMIYFLKKQRK